MSGRSITMAFVLYASYAHGDERCVADARLVTVAQRAADDPYGFTAVSLRTAAWREGVRAAAVLALVLEGGDEVSRRAAALRWYETHGASPDRARCAVATSAAGVFATVLVPRVVDVRDVAPGAWQIAWPTGARAMSLVATAPNGTVSRASIAADGRVTLPVGDAVGWRFQVMAEFGTGPTPVAAWGTDDPASTSLPPLWSTRALFAALNDARAVAGVAPLRRDLTLDCVAEGHARTLAMRGEVSHVPREDDTPIRRLQAVGIETTRVAENVARAATLAEAHDHLMASPAHRANILDVQVDAVGIGIARQGSTLYVVEVFATRPAWIRTSFAAP